MKTIAIVALILIVLVVVGHAVLAASAPSVDQASALLAGTERELAQVVAKSAITSQALDHGLDAPQGIAQELQEFDRASERLDRLVKELDKEIIAYNNACNRKMVAFNQELNAINDTSTRRHLEHLRNRANTKIARRLNRSRAALAALQNLVARGADIQHAVRCVDLARDVELQGNDLTAQVRFTREQAAEYHRRTNALLATLTTPAETTD